VEVYQKGPTRAREDHIALSGKELIVGKYKIKVNHRTTPYLAMTCLGNTLETRRALLDVPAAAGDPRDGGAARLRRVRVTQDALPMPIQVSQPSMGVPVPGDDAG
jgi:hypothetical protein